MIPESKDLTVSYDTNDAAIDLFLNNIHENADIGGPSWCKQPNTSHGYYNAPWKKWKYNAQKYNVAIIISIEEANVT